MADEAVRAYYAQPAHFKPTDIGSKLFDWGLLSHIGYGPLLEGKRVLNWGPSGVDEAVLAGQCALWAGVDFMPEIIANVRTAWRYPHWGNVLFEVADIRDLPFNDSSFDTVLDFSTGDHVQEGRTKMHQEAWRVLRPGGYYVVTYANACFLDHVRESLEYGYERRLTPQEIMAEIEGVGFQVVHQAAPGARSGLIAHKRGKEPNGSGGAS